MVLRRTAAVGRKRRFGLRLWLREYFAALRICINAEWLDISGSRFFPHGPGSLNRALLSHPIPLGLLFMR
jgi:hypothetical protein